MKVSVIVPAYNAEQTISLCLEALGKQDYPSGDYEVIVVDDGSSDRTGKLARVFSVRYIYQENQGPATARNKGAEDAEGEILLFTDADCVVSSNWITEMIRPFTDMEVMAVKGAYRTRQKSLVARFVQLEFEERFDKLARMESIDMVDTYSAGYRRRVFMDLKGFDTRFPTANNEDTELSYRMSMQQMKMIFAPKAIVFHLGHPTSIGCYARLKLSRGYWRMVVYKTYPGKILKDSYTPQSLKLQILVVFLFLLMLPISFFWPQGGLTALLSLFLLYGASIFRFILTSLRKDPVVGFCAPFFLAVRAASLGIGVIWGVLRGKL